MTSPTLRSPPSPPAGLSRPLSLLEHLEDRRRDWQTACASPVEDCARNLTTRLAAFLPNPVGPLTPEQAARLGSVNEGVRDWAGKQLLPQCLTWLREAKLWPEAVPNEDFVRSELTAALQNLPVFNARPPEPAAQLPTSSSVLAAAVGAALGMLFLTPLALLVLGQRETGLFAGGVFGAAFLVGLIGFLATAPAVRAALSSALLVSGTGSLVAGVWSYWRRQSTGWLRGSLGLLATSLVVVLARPRLSWPKREDYLNDVNQQLTLHLQHVADLVLAWCWAHPARVPAAPQAPQNEGSQLPGLAWAALADLHAQLASCPGTPDDLRDSVEELLQRFEDDGYEWKAVEDKTPFDEAMREDFDTFGLITPGQPVRTRRAAVRHRGRLVRKGELRRV